MLSFAIICTLTCLLIGFGLYEYQRHKRYLLSIPHRIHINGTRGKSSVTRLIGAGLRAGGYRTITKVTGTFPRMILPDGQEAAIYRKEKANILEQLEIIKFCAEQEVDVLIIECMALQPIYQKITEHQMVRATLGIITNIRMDHLDVMGPTIHNVAKAICQTIPKRSKFFTAEDRFASYMQQIAKHRKTQFTQTQPTSVCDEDMIGFPYIEHKENVALALAVCNDFGVDKATALEAMQKAVPDEGVLKRYTIKTPQKRIHFYNALAANDPESTTMIWNAIVDRSEKGEHFMFLLNTRKDRQDRAVRLVAMMAKLKYHSIALIGESLEMVLQMCKKQGIDRDAIHAVGAVHTEKKYTTLLDAAVSKTTIVAIGNMGAGGSDLAEIFEHNHQL